MVVSIGRSSTCVLKGSSERSNRFAGRIGVRYGTIIESARVNLSVAFTFKRVTDPFYLNGSQTHFTQTSRSRILRKRVAAAFYVNGSQTHFTQTGRSPILRRRAAAAFYADGSQPHFTQTGHSPILREDRHRHELGELALVGLRRCCCVRSSG
jgi:hypothetical protein